MADQLFKIRQKERVDRTSKERKLRSEMNVWNYGFCFISIYLKAIFQDMIILVNYQKYLIVHMALIIQNPG